MRLFFFSFFAFPRYVDGPYKVISHDVDHEKHPTGVKGISQGFQVIGSAEFRIQRVSVSKKKKKNHRSARVCSQRSMEQGCAQVFLPITVIRRCICRIHIVVPLGCHWSNPDSCEAHILDVIQLGNKVSDEVDMSENQKPLTLLMIPRHVPPQYFCMCTVSMEKTPCTSREEKHRVSCIPRQWCHREPWSNCRYAQTGPSA